MQTPVSLEQVLRGASDLIKNVKLLSLGWRKKFYLSDKVAQEVLSFFLAQTLSKMYNFFSHPGPYKTDPRVSLPKPRYKRPLWQYGGLEYLTTLEAPL